MAGSTGRGGAAGDNAAMESFFSLLKKNVLDRRSWATRQELRIAVVTSRGPTHRRRRQASLGRPTPVEFGTVMTVPAHRAARLNLSPNPAADALVEWYPACDDSSTPCAVTELGDQVALVQAVVGDPAHGDLGEPNGFRYFRPAPCAQQ
ncbi:hypothetical protein GCM10010121_083780 [Streptomyces brasiliensis]|uniref:Integrase catalytic domain-containing protein n=1 Tax=Streptomyces brasiliensis TaxID=1954 RepID=A0A917P3X2_9ACTN|nr:hypothetical protein GCM10010121_083780 [Streptomyces brasiliensis]